MQRRTILQGLIAGSATAALSGAVIGARPAFGQPTGADLVEAIRSTHPRLLLTDWEEIRARVASSERLQGWLAALRQQADEVMDLPPQGYSIPDGQRLNTAPTLTRTYLLGLVHGVTGESRYAERLWNELEEPVSWPDWHPPHFLDTASITHAVAIGLDWLHDVLSAAQREALSTAIVQHGLEPGRAEYESGAVWTEAAHNWNTVCNSGLSLGSLAVVEDAPELAEFLLTRAMETVPVAVEQYAPDGGFPEGVGYWRYSTEYLVVLMSALATATGSSQGLDQMAGMDHTGHFPITMTGPQDTVFNFYDSPLPSPHSPESFWLGQRYDDSMVTHDAMVRADTYPHPKDIIWADPDHEDGARLQRESPLDSAWQRIAVASTRSSWTDPAAQFVGIKGGRNDAHHGDADLGTFVFDARGVRWATDLGPDDYNLYGYFHMLEGQMRWNYYRKRTEGHNTLVFAPDDRDGFAGQPLAGVGRIQSRTSSARGSSVILDLDDASDKASRWRRGLQLFDHRRQLIIRDEFELARRGDAWWFWHTEADADVADDGLSCVLTRGVERLLLRLVGDVPDCARFVQTAAAPLWSSPDPTQTANTGVTRVAVWIRGVTKASITVQASPLAPGQQAPAPRDPGPVKSWTAERQPPMLAREIRVDGMPLPDFVPGVLSYTVSRTPGGALPVVEADVARGVARIDLPERIPGEAVVHVPGGTDYRIRFDSSVGLLPGVVVAASSHDGNIPENTLDGDPQTRWSAQGPGQWIRYDLGEIITVDRIKIIFLSGDQRVSMFTLAVSDGGAWQEVYAGASSGTTAGFEEFTFDAAPARFVKITGLGNSTNEWNSIAEVQIPGATLMLPDVAVHLQDVQVAGASMIPEGTTVTLTAQATMSDGTAAESITWSWSTADATVATVDDHGVVTGVGRGSTTIGAVATAADGTTVWAGRGVTVHDANEIHLEASADTYAQSGGSSSTNFGSEPVLICKTDPVTSREIFLGFDAAALSGQQIDSAELTVKMSVSDGAGSSTDVTVHPVTEPWAEAELTWDTRPSLGDAVATGHVDGASDLALDVSALVRQAVVDGRSIDLAIRQVPVNGIGRYTTTPSRETGKGPVLVVRRA